MHRPTRQHENLEAKLARKVAVTEKRGRKAGKKTKRWKKSLAHYETLCQNHAPRE